MSAEIDSSGSGVGVSMKRRRSLDLVIGFFSLFMQVGTGLIMLPLTATMLAPAEVTFWAVFLSMQAFSNLLEFGFTPSFSRNFTYVLSGANELTAEGVPAEKSGAVNRVLLCDLLTASRAVYAFLSFAILVALGIGGSLYINALMHTAEDVEGVWASWALFVAAIVFHTYMNWQAGVVMGSDRMREYYQIVMVSRVVQVVLSIIGLMIKPDLISLAIAYAISAVVMRVHYQMVAYRVTHLVAGMRSETGAIRRILGFVTPNSIRLGWVTVGNYLTNRFSFLAMSLSLGAVVTAEYAIAQQAFFALFAIAGVAGHLTNARMASARVAGDKAIMRDIYAFTVVFAAAVFLAGAVFMMLFGDPLLRLIGSQTFLPALPVLVALTVLFLLDLNTNLSMGIISTGNSVPYVRSVLFTGAVIAVASIGVGAAGGGIMVYILVQGLAQICFNHWRWPLYAARELGLTVGGFGPAALSGARRMLFDRV